MGLSGEALAAWVEASCEAQGVPVKVTDAGAVDRVVVLLGGGVGGRAQPALPAPAASELPDDGNSVGVEFSGARGPRADDHSVNDGVHDGGLAGEVERFPLGA